MYRNILFPTDGSPGSETAKAHAADLAKKYDAHVHILYVADSSNEPSTYVMRDDDVGDTGMVKPDDIEEKSGYTAKGTGQMERIEEAGARLVDEVATEFSNEGIEVTTEVMDGNPYQAITTYADETGVDLIVMATHGRSGLDRYLLGSVTEKVVRTADVPVLTVRLEE